MKQRFAAWTARIDRASLRERVLLFATGVVALCALWVQLVMVPLGAERARIAAGLSTLRAHARAAGTDDAVLRYAALKSRQYALAQAIRDTDASLGAAQRGMIDPKSMVAVLTDVLRHQKNLTLVLLKNLPVVPLLPPPPTPGGAGAAGTGGAAGATAVAVPDGGPYLHPVELVVRGNYLDVLAYVKALEAQSWGFTWRRFEFKSTDRGPEYHIEFTTLSMQSNWLGV